MNRLDLLVVISSIIALIVVGTSPAIAGDGEVVDNGSFGVLNLSANFQFNSDSTNVANLKQEISDASALLWDATDGQVRIGDVTLMETDVNQDLADIRVSFRADGRANAHVDGIGVRGDRVLAFRDAYPGSQSGFIVAHELGHYALGLYDEYREGLCTLNSRSMGNCIESGDRTDQNN